MRVQAAAKQEHTGLIPVESVNAIELFTGGGLDALLQQIEAEVQDAPTDTSTERARKEIASTAYKVSRSKVVIDDAGKALVAEWKKKSSEVDAGRKKARDTLDALRDKVRQPLTDYENEQARIEGEKRMAAAAEAQRIEEEKEAALLKRELLILEKEAAIAKQEAERLEKERQAQAEAARKAREEEIKREAEERATALAAEALQRQQEATARAEQQAKDAEARREREAKEAEERAVREKAEAEEYARLRAEEAVEAERLKATREAAERERLRRAEEEAKRQQEAARTADKANREKINGEIIAALTAERIGEQTAVKIIQLIAAGSVPHVRITY